MAMHLLSTFLVVGGRIMVVKKFHGIEFELPKDYHLVDKDSYLVFRNNKKSNKV